MEANLTEKEIIEIAQKAVLLISTEKGVEYISKEFDERVKKQAMSLLDSSFIRTETKIEAALLIELAISDFIKKNQYFEKIVYKCISEYFSTEKFKKASIEHLKRRIRQLEEELEKEYEED